MAKAEQNSVDLKTEDTLGFKCIAKSQIAFATTNITASSLCVHLKMFF